jgi:epoxide hydrolase-like predicted phosphatase
MIEAVRAARAAGVRTGLISNSWTLDHYPRPLLAELFEGTIISGEVGIRKPTPRIYEMGTEAIGVAPELCVFVDDLPFNLTPAEEMGMRTIHHTDAAETIGQLQELFALTLR